MITKSELLKVLCAVGDASLYVYENEHGPGRRKLLDAAHVLHGYIADQFEEM